MHKDSLWYFKQEARVTWVLTNDRWILVIRFHQSLHDISNRRTLRMDRRWWVITQTWEIHWLLVVVDWSLIGVMLCFPAWNWNQSLSNKLQHYLYCWQHHPASILGSLCGLPIAIVNWNRMPGGNHASEKVILVLQLTSSTSNIMPVAPFYYQIILNWICADSAPKCQILQNIGTKHD